MIFYYDSQIFDKSGNITQDIDEAKSYLEKLDAFDYKFKVGDYFFNKWHFRSDNQSLCALANKGQMKISFKDVLTITCSKET